MKWKKGGSLALSMNAIVVLILAIAMLGVGLYTVRLVKTRLVGEFAKIEAEIPDPSRVSASFPVSVSPPVLVGSSGEKVGMKTNVYNIGTEPLTPTITITEDCGIVSGVDVNLKEIIAMIKK